MAHLYSNLDRFNPRKISKSSRQRVKAFSYFGTVAKNYLVQKSIKRSKVGYLNEDSEGNEVSLDSNNDLVSENFTEDLEMKEFFSLLIENFEKNRHYFSEEKKKVCDAIIFFLENSKRESIHNKKHFYLLLKEYTGLSAKQITVILNEFRKDYSKIRDKYYKEYV